MHDYMSGYARKDIKDNKYIKNEKKYNIIDHNMRNNKRNRCEVSHKNKIKVI